MLNQSESDRPTTLELILLINNSETVLSKILTPFLEIFPPKVVGSGENTKIDYNYKFLFYSGNA